MSIEAMKQALEALERGRSQIIGALVQQDQDEAITALRQAIAEAEKQEPVVPAGVINAIRNVGLTLIKTQQGYVLQRIEGIKAQTAAPVHARPVVHEVRCTYPQCQSTNGCVGACSKGQAEKQEPVVGTKTWFEDGKMVTQHLYASDISQEPVDETAKDRHVWVEQPDLARVGEVGVWGDKREWVGLTDEERSYCLQSAHNVGWWKAAKFIEAKLKEKNCG